MNFFLSRKLEFLNSFKIYWKYPVSNFFKLKAIEVSMREGHNGVPSHLKVRDMRVPK